MAADPKYTVFIRVPIPRGDFVDPPPVDWDSTKDEALWRILSGAAQTEIDWNQIANDFDVSVDFLLKQVAYLTERHASQVRAQVRKATAAAKGSTGPSPTPTTETPAPGHQRTASALSRRDSPLPRSDDGGSATPLNRSSRPNISRNTSANTSTLRDGGGPSPRPAKAVPARQAEQTARRRLSSLPITTTVPESEGADAEPLRSPSPGPAEPSSSSSSDDDSLPAQSRIIRRPPRFQQKDQPKRYDEEDDDDDESEPAFQPYRATADQSAAQDLASTLRGDSRTSSRRPTRKEPVHLSQTSDSSVGSAAQGQRKGKQREQNPAGPLSPRRTAELSGKSPGAKSRGYSREGSDGTPSMGSSFSDLDDASVTQSALEEALASHMNRPGASRFSISQAFRSRHTANPNK
ncbi:multidomain presynaptic cytomatrix related protein [Sarocladium implicatum]|nr:multidomain presynaptic cytomatrix related protein [Sarocladium implicatum]